MNSKYRGLISALLAWGCLGLPNANADVMLATINFTLGAGESPPLTGIDGGLILSTNGAAAAPDCIGCSAYIAPGHYSNVTYDFTAGNSPYWNNFVTLLTNGTDQTVSAGFLFFQNGSFEGGGSEGNTESRSFGAVLASPQIVSSVDLIQLDLDSLDFARGQFGYVAVGIGTWEIFGTPGPDFQGPYYSLIPLPPPAVPEPSALALLSLGLAAVGIRRRRRRGSMRTIGASV